MTHDQIRMTAAPFYDGWTNYQRLFTEAIANLTPEQLLLRATPGQWAIWQIVAHVATAREYWFRHLGESTEDVAALFPHSADGLGWEDDEDHPQMNDELVHALEITWSMIDDRLRRWTPAMLQAEFSRERDGRRHVFTRQSTIMRLIGHDTFHAGEVSMLLGAQGLPAIDLWRPADTWLPAAEASSSREG
ncbi:MAG: DUF664 domain-containing protein [Dehalococcoidia bacterium]|nr:DUF664 domain-containing protein [Dehalococcoidia bacterium]